MVDQRMRVPVEIIKRAPLDEPGFVRRLRLRATRQVLRMRRLWARELVGNEQGLVISHAEVDRILEDPAVSAEAEAAFEASDESARKLQRAIEAADVRCDADGRWNWLLGEFGLSQAEADLLSMVVAVELDPWLKRVYGYLNDDATACYPTLALARALFGWASGVRIGADSALVRWLIARPLDGVGNPWTESSPWAVDPLIVAWFAAGEGEPAPLDAVLGQDAEWFVAQASGLRTRMQSALGPIANGHAAYKDTLKPSCLYPEQLTAMKEFARAMRLAGEAAFTLELTGMEGAGKRTLAAQFAHDLGMTLLVVDARVLTQHAENGIRAARLARLTRAVLYWRLADTLDAPAWRSLAGLCAVTIIGSASPLAGQPGGTPLRSLRLPALARQQRIALWTRLAGSVAAIPKPVVDWVLLPSEITAAASVAGAGERVIEDYFHRVVYRAPGELFSPLQCPYTWDDIVLPANLREHLEELEAQARLRSAVYDDWGFSRLVPLGGGITSLFAGPSGTGKTMAAQVLAHSLGMDLYRVDLAGVINKYIGETEKRLKQVFETCERANVMLFFDEADALFGQRTQVKDAHDRYANTQIDYLLQRMEQFDGIAILATNRKSDLDQAFLRRIRFIIDFLPPGPVERLKLWQLALLERSPGGQQLLSSVDWDFLATRLTMTGADIKAAALGAAFRARSEGSRITMRHILAAARREMTKHGVALRTADLEGA
jgi:hypothetical protein